jgi:phosphatidylglycerol:prolipoprotein diacylglycerol transferase
MVLAIPFPDIGPEIFAVDIGGFHLALRWYALAYIAGILIGWQLIAAALRRPSLWPGDTAPMTKDHLDDFLTWSILGVILGGRLGYVLFYKPAYFAANPAEIPAVWQGGMSFHGGFLGVIAVAVIFARRNAIPLPQLADALAIAAPVGLMLGRIANFINAELWGRPTDVPWSVVFPGAAAQDCPGVLGPCARHPSQLYEAGLEGLALGALLVFLAFGRGWFKTPWRLTGLFFAGYGLSRFVVEFYRQADDQYITADNPLGHVIRLGEAGLSMGQLLSLPMIAVGLALIVWAKRRSWAG